VALAGAFVFALAGAVTGTAAGFFDLAGAFAAFCSSEVFAARATQALGWLCR
jgi:hypothetical protein